MTEKEKLYIADVSPLVVELKRVCEQHRMAFMVAFDLGHREGDPDGHLVHVNYLMDDDCDPSLALMIVADFLRHGDSAESRAAMRTGPAQAGGPA